MLTSAATVQDAEIFSPIYVWSNTFSSDLSGDLGEEPVLPKAHLDRTENTLFLVTSQGQGISVSIKTPETVGGDIDRLRAPITTYVGGDAAFGTSSAAVPVGEFITAIATLDLWGGNYGVTSTPFGQLLARENNERRRLIVNVKDTRIPYANRLFNRLLSLESATEEEYPYTERISVDSLKGFVKFLKEFNDLNLKYPDITVTPSGNIQSEWQTDQEHYFSIEIISPQEVKVVLFTPDTKVLGKVSRIAIKMSIVSIFENLLSFNILGWVAE